MDNPVSKYLSAQYDSMVNWVNGNIDPLTDEELQMELSPGKNHGIWILGHLIAVSYTHLDVYKRQDL